VKTEKAEKAEKAVYIAKAVKTARRKGKVKVQGHALTISTAKVRGRPVTQQIKLHSTPEEVARAIFSAVKPPDPKKRIKGA